MAFEGINLTVRRIKITVLLPKITAVWVLNVTCGL